MPGILALAAARSRHGLVDRGREIVLHMSMFHPRYPDVRTCEFARGLRPFSSVIRVLLFPLRTLRSPR